LASGDFDNMFCTKFDIKRAWVGLDRLIIYMCLQDYE
jgi:hypothetical protein